VIVASRNLDKLQEVAENIQSETGSETAAVQVDVTDEESVKRLAEQVIEKFGTVDILASKASDFMTGQIIYVDGGLTALG